MRAPTLQGEMIVLRPLEGRDADAVYELLSDPEGRRLVGGTRQYTRAEIPAAIARAAASEDRLVLAVTANGDDEYLGQIALESIDPVVGAASVTLQMRPAYRGRGYGTEAIELVLGFAFDGLGLHRVGIEVLAINARAKSLYENLGFRVEGRLRDAYRDGDGWCDGILMGLLEDEYRAGQPA
ncbi:GNAT family N-acetyltransferase [Cellulomonas sp. SG140]|uniref:GNAT family N-acetyltransferase n=1 Tax=Cellulomonas sp. SG140 TaxID=2976536 RepID=UPI0021E72170|nr:GNAT family protein [Cellulomonas sp. SG140]